MLIKQQYLPYTPYFQGQDIRHLYHYSTQHHHRRYTWATNTK